MKKDEIMKTIGRTVHKIGFQLKKKSPEILVGAGIVGTVVSTVLACKATPKAVEVVQDTKKTVDAIREAGEKGVNRAGTDYTKEDYRNDLVITYVQTGVKFTKLYGPAVALGAASIASILASHNIMRKRNAAIASAYAALDKAFKGYRGRVIDRFGEQVEKELRYNIKSQEIEETVMNESGETETVKNTVNVADAGWDPNKYSPYARIFDESHPDWLKDAEQNLYRLKALQAQANDMLKARGHLFLNEVYDLLGFKRSTAGTAVGWVYDPRDPIGDNFVDFGLYEVARPKAVDFVNGYERSFILDFNVVGDITNYIEDHQYL